MKKLKLTSDTIDNILESLLKRSPNQYTEYESTVTEIVNTVREKGTSDAHHMDGLKRNE